jgi:hypothetical protein
MAKNIKLQGVMPEFYQAATRPVNDITLDELEGKSEAFNGFQVEVGDVYKFPTIEEQQFKRQRVQRKLRPNEEATYVYSVACVRVRGGVETNVWFSLNFLNKQDADRNYVNPSWANLGDAKQRAIALSKMGEITVTGKKSIKTPVFVNGRPNRVPTLDVATGEQMIAPDGTAMTHVETRDQDAYIITEYNPDVEAA